MAAHNRYHCRAHCSYPRDLHVLFGKAWITPSVQLAGRSKPHWRRLNSKSKQHITLSRRFLSSKALNSLFFCWHIYIHIYTNGRITLLRIRAQGNNNEIRKSEIHFRWRAPCRHDVIINIKLLLIVTQNFTARAPLVLASEENLKRPAGLSWEATRPAYNYSSIDLRFKYCVCRRWARYYVHACRGHPSPTLNWAED